MKPQKKILVLCPHPENVAPGQRLKYEQYFDSWRMNGYTVDISPFMNLRFWNIVYKKGFFFGKAIWTINGYLLRFTDLFRIPFYDIIYVFLWGTPFGKHFYEFFLVKLSRKLVYDIDDMVFLGHSSAANRSWQVLKGRTKMIYLMKHADHVITCTPKLDAFVRKFNGNTTDISSTVDTERRYLPADNYGRKEQIILGWSGSHSTSRYLYILTDVLKRLSGKYNLKLLVMGDGSFQIPGIDIEAHEWAEEIEIPTLRRFDIGLYPLPDEEWVYGKSGLKAIQYMALGVPTVATAIGANFRIIENGINGFLVEPGNLAGWENVLSRLIEDNVLRKAIGLNGRRTIVTHYSVKSKEPVYLDILKKLS